MIMVSKTTTTTTTTTTTATIELEVFVDENERYWVGKGFIKGGLFPNDRGCFSSTDGSLSWKSLLEVADDELLLGGRGWSYKEDDDNKNFRPSLKDDPERCWMYATDFRPDQILLAKPDRGMLHMVRYRRLSRTKVFDPDQFVPKQVYEKCDHCDSNAVNNLSNQLLDVIAYCTLLHNVKELTDTVALPMKRKVVELAVSQVPRQTSDPPVTFASHQMYALRKRLENFTEEEKGRTGMGRLFSGIDYSYSSCNNHKEFLDRRKVTERVIPKIERDAISSLIVKKLDIYFQLHCNVPNCGMECKFARVECPNEGCTDILSRLHLESHINICPYTIITCKCGESFQRRELSQHQSEACPLRDVHCPFRSIGCVTVVQACDVQMHIDNNMNNHLLLAVDRISEYSQTTKDLVDRVATLENENTELKKDLLAQKVDLRKKITSVDDKVSKTTKNLNNLEAKFKKEIKNK